MTHNFLFPHQYKKFGWMILIPTALLGIYMITFDAAPSFLDFKVFSLSNNGVFAKSSFSIIEDNIANEILGILITISSLVVAFSKEKNEDEFISKIRLESLVWSTYANYGFLLFALFFFYSFSFLNFMIYNLFTILVFFIIRFNWKVWKLQKQADNEE